MQVNRMTLQRKLPRRSRFAYLHRFFSHKNQSLIFCESKLEAHTALLLEFENSIVAYTSQPFTTRYSLNGRVYRYTPDFLLKSVSGEFKSIEVKLSSKLNTPKQIEKFAALDLHFSRELYHPLQLITEKEIYHGAKVDNYQKLYQFRQLPLTPIEQARFTELNIDTLTFSELVTLVSKYSSRPFCQAMKLLGHDLFAFSLVKPLNENTILTKLENL